MNREESEMTQEEMDRFEHWKQAEAEGRLLELPCAAGTMVYEIVDDCTFPDDCHTKRMCNGCGFRDLHIETATLSSVQEIVDRLPEFGRTVFLTKEAAEAALMQ